MRASGNPRTYYFLFQSLFAERTQLRYSLQPPKHTEKNPLRELSAVHSCTGENYASVQSTLSKNCVNSMLSLSLCLKIYLSSLYKSVVTLRCWLNSQGNSSVYLLSICRKQHSGIRGGIKLIFCKKTSLDILNCRAPFLEVCGESGSLSGMGIHYPRLQASALATCCSHLFLLRFASLPAVRMNFWKRSALSMAHAGAENPSVVHTLMGTFSVTLKIPGLST